MVDLEKQEFPYPKCWSDDIRMNVLMAPFRSKFVNPENYDSKMNFWLDMIQKFCEYKGSPSFNKSELQSAFNRKGKVPYGLDDVLEEMHTSGKTRLKAEYMYDPNNGWTGWAMNSFVKKPLRWGMKKVSSSVNDSDGVVDVMHLEQVNKFCRDLSVVLQKHSGKLLQYEDLKAIVNDSMNLNSDGLQICLHTLHCQKKIILEYTVENKEKTIHLVKIPGKSDENPEITEADRAFHNLQMTQKYLTNQLEDFEKDIIALDDKVRMYMKENKREIAKTYLLKKHRLEKNHENRSKALNNVETLLSNMEDAQSNGKILDAYKIGSNALQKALNNSNLNYIDGILSDVKEAIENHDEIQDTMANANPNAKFDDTDLEKELQDLLKEEPDEKAAKTIANNNQKASEITDAELLAMLEGLDIPSDSPKKADANGNQTAPTDKTL